MRFHPGPAAVKRALDAGVIGSPIAARIYCGSYLPGWRPGSNYTLSYSASPEHGGAVLDCIHEIDLALFYFGPARLRSASVLPATAIGLHTDGLAELTLQHAAGVLSSVHLNFVQRNYSRGCEVIGHDGTLTWNFTRRTVERFGPDGALAETIAEPADWDVNKMYVDELVHFLGACASGRPSCNPLAGGVEALSIALAARAQRLDLERAVRI
jgi:predicted dehydrogenase